MSNVITKLAVDFGNRTALAYDGNKVYKITSSRYQLAGHDIAGRKSSKSQVYIRTRQPEGDLSFVVGADEKDAEFTYRTDKFKVAQTLLMGLLWQLPDVCRIDELIIIDSLPNDANRRNQYLVNIPREIGWQTTDKKGNIVERKLSITNKMSFVKEGLGAVVQAGLLNSSALAVNLGCGTLDFVTFNRGEVVEKLSTNFDKEGAISFQRELQRDIGGFTKQPYEIFRALENGGELKYLDSNLDEKTINIKDQAKDTCYRWLKQNVGVAIKELGGLPQGCPVIITGGLANLVSDQYKDHPVISVVKNPEQANVRVF